jgi:hypothetical protein
LHHRIFLAGFFAALLSVLGAVAGINFVVDPFHYYRGMNVINHVLFPGFQRLQNVGLARSFHYDTVIVGTSVTENFLPSDVERVWGGRVMKLSISGSTAHEQYLILQQAIASGQVKRVFWGLDVESFYGGGPRWVRDDQGPFPYFMYRPSPLFNIEYPLSLSTLNLSTRVLKGWGETDLDTLDTWYRRFQFGPAVVLANRSGNCGLFRRKYRPDQSSLPRHMIEDMGESVRQNLTAVVDANPWIEFYLFFPPLTQLIYIPADSGLLSNSLPFRRVVAGELAEKPNVQLFDFQVAPGLTRDLRHYKDMMHYDLATSEYLIKAMHERRGLVNDQQVLADNGWLIDEVNSYDLCGGGGPLAQGQPSKAVPEPPVASGRE